MLAVPLGETRELARAYATLAALRMTRNENDEAIELARRAEALARSLGASDVIADALNTEGCAASAGCGRREGGAELP